MTHRLESEYNQLQREVAEFKRELEASEIFSSIKPIYRGFQILYSPLQFKPDFMFVGINPGAGYFNSTGELANRLEPESTMEYVFENYALANETKKLFQLLGLSNTELSKAVKSNFYFIATENEKGLNEIITLLDILDFEKKSMDWNNRLIEMIQPKIIICEGKSAFTKVTQQKNLQSKWESDVAYAKWRSTHIFGYKRLFSQIKNKKKLSEGILNEININNFN